MRKSLASKYFVYIIISLDLVLAAVYLILYGAFHLFNLWNNYNNLSRIRVVDIMAFFTAILILSLIYFLVKGLSYLRVVNSCSWWQALKLMLYSGLTILICMLLFIYDFSLIEVLDDAKGILAKAWIILFVIGLRFLPIYLLVKAVRSISDFSHETLGVQG